MEDVHDPMEGKKVKRIVHTETNCIVVKRSDISSIAQSFLDQSKGDGALKMAKIILYGTHTVVFQEILFRKI